MPPATVEPFLGDAGEREDGLLASIAPPVPPTVARFTEPGERVDSRVGSRGEVDPRLVGLRALPPGLSVEPLEAGVTLSLLPRNLKTEPRCAAIGESEGGVRAASNTDFRGEESPPGVDGRDDGREDGRPSISGLAETIIEDPLLLVIFGLALSRTLSLTWLVGRRALFSLSLPPIDSLADGEATDPRFDEGDTVLRDELRLPVPGSSAFLSLLPVNMTDMRCNADCFCDEEP